MATRTQANSNNFIRWDKISGTVTPETLELFGVPPFEEPGLADWTGVSSVEDNDWFGVAFGDDKFVAVANDGTNRIQYSNDNGRSWTAAGTLVATFNQAYALAAPALWEGSFFRSDGLKYYLVNNQGDTVHEYDMSTAWDISTSSVVGSLATSVELALRDCHFKPDGTKMYLTGQTNNQVHEYDLSVAWDISTAVLLQSTSTFASVTIEALFMKPDGLKLYLVDNNNDEIREYDLSVAWDISTVSTVVNTLSVGSVDNDPKGMFMNSTGIKMYFVGGQNDSVYEYDLSTAWDISTASILRTLDVSAQDILPKSVWLDPNLDKMFVLGDNNNNVNEYDITLSTSSWDTNVFQCVAHNGTNRWVALSTGGGTNRAWWSDDGIIWDQTSAAENNTWNDVVFANNKFVAVSSDGTNRVMTSTDGRTWVSASASAARAWVSITFDSSIFVAASSTGGTTDVMTSPDGTNWTTQTSPNDTFQSVGSGNGLFVLLGSTNLIYTSVDGITWTQRTPAQASTYQDVTFGDGVYVAVKLAADTNATMFSTNGIDWTLKAFPASTQFKSIAFGNNTFVAVGVSTGTSSTGHTQVQTLPTEYGNENQYDDVENVVVNLFPSENLSFYANIDTLEDNANFASWSLRLIHADSNIVAYADIAALTQDVISGSDYRFYLDGYAVPEDFVDGCYRMIIVDETDDSILYISNKVRLNNTIVPKTFQIRYRNTVNILNFNYETLSNFKNEVRIDLIKRQPSYPTVRDGYDLVSGSFNAVRTVKGKAFQFVTDAYNEDDHEAFNSALIQDLEIKINGEWKTFVRGEDDYVVEWLENYPLADGSITLEQQDTFSSNKNV